MKITDFYNHKKGSKKISMVTAYDYTTALIVRDSDVDCVLVGDSLAMTMYGKKTTIWATPQVMALHTRAVSNAVKNKLIISDMPFLSFRQGTNKAMTVVEKLIKAGAQAVKIEGVDGHEDVIEHIVKSDVPVMGHIGLTPQSIHKFGGYKIQGKDKKSEKVLIKQAKKLQNLGCFSIVLECMPQKLAKKITQTLKIPTIGIGAGPHCDGQVLVIQDLIGMHKNLSLSFVKTYLNGYELIKTALDKFNKDIKENRFP